MDVPIGPNNHFEAGNPDMGHPTHFLTRRRFGMFVVTVPKELPRTQKIAWTYSRKASTTVKFSQPGDYVLHVTANDYSGNGGGGSGCCWTTAIIKVGVKAADPGTNGAR